MLCGGSALSKHGAGPAPLRRGLGGRPVMAAPCAVWLGDLVERVPCPYDVHHRVPRASLERHVASCRLRKMGYSAEEEAEMYDSSFFYENLKVPTVAMDKDLQFHIVKQARAQSAKEGTGYSEANGALTDSCLGRSFHVMGTVFGARRVHFRWREVVTH